jgi:hypothetical protein
VLECHRFARIHFFRKSGAEKDDRVFAVGRAWNVLAELRAQLCALRKRSQRRPRLLE